MNWLQQISSLRLPALKRGMHDSPEQGVCAMEMIAFLERLPHSDHPPCTCPVIAAYVRGVNDTLSDNDRQRLLPYLPRLVDTVSPEHEKARAEYLAWQAIRVFAPLALRTVGAVQVAEKLESQVDLEAAAAAAYAAPTYAAHAAAAATYAYADAADIALAALDGVLQIGAASLRKWPRERVAELEALA